MEQDIWKNAFDQLKLTEETKEQVWEGIVQKSSGKEREARGRHRGRHGRASLGMWAVAALACSFLLGIVLINIQTEGKILKAVQGIWKVDRPSKEIVEQTTLQFDSIDAPKLVDCSKDRLLIASTMGIVVYDREQDRVSGTIDLKSIGCFYVDNDWEEDSVKTRILPEGDRLTIYNHPAEGKAQGDCYLFNLAECRSAERGEVKALEAEKRVPVTDALEKRWKEYDKVSRKSTFDSKIYVHFRPQLKREAEGSGIIFTSQVISWRDENQEKYYSALAYAVAKVQDGGQGKKEQRFLLYSKNRDTGEMEERVLKLKANMPDDKEERLPAYQCSWKNPIRKALADCAGDNIVRYLGKYYGRGRKRHFAQDEPYPEGTPVLPIIRIYAVKEGKNYTKVYGEFSTLGLARSGDVLYEVYFPGFTGYGCAYLKKTAGGYAVEKVLHPRDGAYYVGDMLAMCDGDQKLYQKVVSGRKKGKGKSYQEMVEEYVEDNGLPVKYFRRSGENLVEIGRP